MQNPEINPSLIASLQIRLQTEQADIYCTVRSRNKKHQQADSSSKQQVDSVAHVKGWQHFYWEGEEVKTPST